MVVDLPHCDGVALAPYFLFFNGLISLRRRNKILLSTELQRPGLEGKEDLWKVCLKMSFDPPQLKLPLLV